MRFRWVMPFCADVVLMCEGRFMRVRCMGLR